ncbi:two-component histidine kinase [Oscillibacter valericigenes Sjm18-20]|nr:two-component histidine kinase [Oscillibacter valericigenes Sjm18-20]
MYDSMPLSLLLNISMLLLAATTLGEFRPLRRLLRPYDVTLKGQMLLALLFGGMAVFSTCFGFETHDAIINTRVVSVTAAGLLGGPVAGIGAGLIGGIHRYFYNSTSFTALGCCVGTVTFGVLGSLAHKYCGGLLRRRSFLVYITAAGELVQAGWLFLLARPFSAVIELESIILIPKIVINSIGMVFFFSVFLQIRRGQADDLIEHQSAALYIADRCLPYLRQGLSNRENLQTAADIIRQHSAGYVVVLTDLEQVLATSGLQLEAPALPEPMRQCMEQDATQVFRTEQRLFGREGSISTPLKANGCVIGALALVVDQGGLRIARADIRFAENLAHFFSTILELNTLDYQIQLRRKAEFRAFQSQINPHFFCNALNTISALCRTDPDKARSLLVVLANYYRQTLSINEEFVTLEDELNNVRNYLTIAQARFVGAIHFTLENFAGGAECRLPPLIVQPLVENAIRHGGVAVNNRVAILRLTADENRLTVTVADGGHGFPEDILQDLNNPNNRRYTGLFNVSKRLVSIYGPESRLQVDSTPEGSTVSFSIPVIPPAAAQPLSMEKAEVL